MITLDFETFYSDEFSLTKLTTEEYIRDPRFEVIGCGVKINDQPTNWVTGSEVEPFLRHLDWDKENLLCHNAAFDGAILKWKYGISPKLYMDTMLICRPKHQMDVGGSLAALCAHYNVGVKGTEVINAKGKRLENFTEDELEAYGGYCKNDVDLTYKLFSAVQDQTTTQELFITDMMLRMFINPVLKLDTELLKMHLGNVRNKKQMLLDRVGAVKAPELMSNTQFADLLRKLGVEPPTKVSPRTGKTALALSKSDAAFKELEHHDDPRVQTLVAARLGIKSTLEETRTQRFIDIAQRGTLPIMLNYYGAHTGRASGGEKINLQNLPRGGTLRHAIMAPDGYTLVAADSAQIEARIVAWLAGEEELVRAFANGDDIYSAFATKVYGYEVTKANNKIERHVGKTCILGLGYGMGAESLKRALKVGNPSVELDLDKAQSSVTLYRTTYPAIPTLWRQADHVLQCMVDGHEAAIGKGVSLKVVAGETSIVLPNGMRIRYPQLEKDATGFKYKNRYGWTYVYGGKLVENVVQALARIVVFNQMGAIEQEFRKYKDGKTRQVVFTVHDEIVVVVPKDEAQHWEQFMLTKMSKAPKWADGLPLACEGAVGLRYGECK